MSAMKKATCVAPSSVIAACHRSFGTMEPRSPAAGYARLITEGITLLGRSERKTGRVGLCRTKYPVFDRKISTHIPSASREQARQLRRTKAIPTFAELYLEAMLAALVERGCMTTGLDVAQRAAEPSSEPAQHRRRAA